MAKRTVKIRTRLIPATDFKGEFIGVTADTIATAKIPFPYAATSPHLAAAAKALNIPETSLFEVGSHASGYFFEATIEEAGQ